jgi:hypothetical protein
MVKGKFVGIREVTAKKTTNMVENHDCVKATNSCSLSSF